MKCANHVFELIGKTPMVRINNMSPNHSVKIYAKLEGSNPMGSLKDRIALKMVLDAEKEGRLTKDKTVLEATSGNTGISVAWVAALKGYKCEIVLPRSVSEERKFHPETAWSQTRSCFNRRRSSEESEKNGRKPTIFHDGPVCQ